MIPAGPVFGSSLGVSGVVGGVGVAGIQSSEFVECFELSYNLVLFRQKEACKTLSADSGLDKDNILNEQSEKYVGRKR